jgi:hypothetical protein
MTKILGFKSQTSFISLNNIMTPFTSKKHILLNSKPIWVIFVALDALNVELQNIF